MTLKTQPCLWLLQACLCIAAMATQLFASSTERPNIVIIMADDLGWADSEVYGSTFYETPNINALAASGVRFLNGHSASPVCSPARASVITGLYAERLGMTQPACHIKMVQLKPSIRKIAWPHQKAVTPKSTTRLDTRFTSFATLLRDSGYRTGHIGKWHLGPEPYSPLEHGFDEDFPHTSAHGPKGSYFGPKKYSDSFTLKEGEHLEDRMADEAVAFIKRNKHRPFLLNYWAFSVHTPPFAKPELLDKYRKKAAKLPASARQRNPLFASMIETFDTNLGRVVDALKAEGIADNTMVIFTSDNGGTLTTNYSSKGYWGNGTKEEILDIPLTSNHPKKQGKGTSWEGGTAVPFLVSWPSKLASGVVSEAFVSGTDIFPTVCEIAGVDLPENLEIDGVSMMPALQQQAPARTTLHGYWPNYFDRPGLKVSPAAWIRQGDHKLLRFFCDANDQSDRLELYNLKKDPSEQHDLAKAMPELANALNEKMTAHLKQTGALIPFANPQYNPSAKKGS